ncbi:TetR/AcrR family transcriptional regulator [Dictyobacter kobayashii]|uniref:TetR family transcriptional regulator n=1 Tax=Dictyobacter kobayashii TaxID=2014872 RepID=A0A402ARH7_9CHLR|nr:TetR/AcrR family transcriptional regulator [Dictyobacter kobayashii]GCE21710.1 TetR family transcriptional regulator [Dictyobacter kobayashii]
MAGKKTFQPEQALDKAMGLFWKQGYEGSSIEDLVQCVGLGRGSLYDTFGDKHTLYLAALKRYLAQSLGRTAALQDQTGSLYEVLEHFFRSNIDLLLDDPARRGCFLVNALLEMAPHDREVSALTQAALQETEEGFYRLLIKAQVAGELSWTCDPHQFAHFLLGTLISIRALARAQQDRRVLEDVVKTALSVFR